MNEHQFKQRTPSTIPWAAILASMTWLSAEEREELRERIGVEDDELTPERG